MEGYDKLALLFSEYPELAAFRRFSRLSMRCLLYRQAEITYLEHDLEFYSAKHTDGQGEPLPSMSWWAFSNQSTEKGGANERELLVKLEERLQSYHSMLRHTAEVLKIGNVKSSDLDSLREWISQPNGGDGFLNGVEFGPWARDHQSDLLTLVPNQQPDRFADHISSKILPKYHDLFGRYARPYHDPQLGDLWRYRRETLSFLGNIVCMLLSFTIPTGSIFALNYINSMLHRLILVSVFIFIFSFAMMFLVGSRRGEVFAATAAFAAIQVVFVGSVNLGTDGPPS